MVIVRQTIICTLFVNVSMLTLVVMPVLSFNESMFIKNLFVGYDPLVRPNKNGEDTIVRLYISPLSIGGLEERKQHLTMTIDISIFWNDPLLTWTRDEPRSLTLPSHYVWTPDISIGNSANNDIKLDTKNNNVLLHRDWYIKTKVVNTYVTSCPVQILKFPFDTQTCNIILIPSGGNSSYTVLDKFENSTNFASFQNSTEWIIVDFSVTPKWRLEMDNKERVESITIITLSLKRRALSHVANSLLPVICLSLLNSFVFMLPAEGGERTGVAISLLLSYAIYMTSINESLPSNSDTLCYFSIYLVCLICKSSAIALATIVSLWLHDKKKGTPFLSTQKVFPKDISKETTKVGTTHVKSFGDDKFKNEELERSSKEENRWKIRAIKFDWFCCICFIPCSILMPTVCITLMLT